MTEFVESLPTKTSTFSGEASGDVLMCTCVILENFPLSPGVIRTRSCFWLRFCSNVLMPSPFVQSQHGGVQMLSCWDFRMVKLRSILSEFQVCFIWTLRFSLRLACGEPRSCQYAFKILRELGVFVEIMVDLDWLHGCSERTWKVLSDISYKQLHGFI